MSVIFQGSPDHTVGVDLELQLVDRETRELVPVAPRLLEELPDVDWAKPELLQSTIEVNSCVCQNIAEAEADLSQKMGQVREFAARHNTAVLTVGPVRFRDGQTRR